MSTITLRQKRADDVVLTSSSVTIGSRSSCGFVLHDPVCAGEHARVRAGTDGFTIEDAGSATGTYVDGRAADAPVALTAGAEIVIGVTRLEVTTATAGELVLTVKGPFHHDDKKDALAWARKEVGFGRFRALAVANVLVGILVLAALPFLLTGGREAALEPGASWHGGRDAFLAMHHDLGLAGEAGCASCHEAFAGAPAGGCLVCHAAEVGPTHHPFHADAASWGEDGCLPCHREHAGADAGALITIPAERTCARCHEADRMTGSRGRALTSAPTVDVPVRFVTFSHAQHAGKTLADGRALACTTCHVAGDGADGRDHAPLTYESCQSCHAPDAPEDRRSGVVLASAWHGAEADDGARCLSCHETLHEAALRRDPHRELAAHFAITPQPHDVFHTRAAEDGATCASCHRDGSELALRRPARPPAPFPHALHVFATAPVDDAARLRTSGAFEPSASLGTCTSCHLETALSDALDDAEPHWDARRCGACHEAHPPVETLTRGEAATRVGFPHAVHRDLAGGCFTCHDLSREGLDGEPFTADDVRDCTACHAGHRAVGVVADVAPDGSCHRCHTEGDGVFANRALTWTRPARGAFRHESPGHAALTRAGDCAACHGEATWTANDLLEVPIPDETGPACRACHVEERARFHWR